MDIKNYINFLKNLLISNKRWIWISCGLFVLSIIAGSVTYQYNTSLVDTLLNQLKNIVGESPKLDFNLVMVIFRQNLQACLIALYGGIIFGVLPFSMVAANGFLIGYIVSHLSSLLEGPGAQKVFVVLMFLVPHGIFELPAILISAAFGLRLGIGWMLKQNKEEQKAEFKTVFYESLKFLPALIAVLFVAALIEVYVTPGLGAWASGRGLE